MSIGDKWSKSGTGAMDKQSSAKLLDAFYDAGGNFIDTANNYQDESSEEIIGEWAEKREIRDQLVIVMKKGSYTRNNVKSMHISMEANLKKLRTSYIDILYLHWWDFDTSIEVMNGLHILVQQGKVLYLGVSDTPAWIMSNTLVTTTPFVICQGMWNVMERSFECDIIPTGRESPAMKIWNSPLGTFLPAGNSARTKKSKGAAKRERSWERTEDERKVSHALEKVAMGVGARHIRAASPLTRTFLEGAKSSLRGNLEALEISLSAKHIK